MNIKSQVVVIGGGNGTANLLRALKPYIKHLTAIVSMADDGGSTGRLRQELDVLPPGDARQCLMALADNDELEQLFSYRFEKGELAGHNFGNLFLSAAERLTGSFEKALTLTAQTLGASGQVLPVSTDNTHLVLAIGSKKIKGQHKIAHTSLASAQPPLQLEPKATLLAASKQAILAADLVIIAPGNLYGSLAPALLVSGMGDVLKKSSAKIIDICNLVNRPGHTTDFMVHTYAQEIERFVGSPIIDYVIYNTKSISPSQLQTGEDVVGIDKAQLELAHYQAIGLQLVSKARFTPNPHDHIAHIRALVRHDGKVLARAIMDLLV